MADHILKTWPVYFDAVKSGQKTFEVRKDDRGFQRGDYLILEKYAPENPHLYRETLKVRVNWVLTGGQFGLKPGYVCMAIGEVRTGEWSEDMCGIM